LTRALPTRRLSSRVRAPCRRRACPSWYPTRCLRTRTGRTELPFLGSARTRAPPHALRATRASCCHMRCMQVSCRRCSPSIRPNDRRTSSTCTSSLRAFGCATRRTRALRSIARRAPSMASESTGARSSTASLRAMAWAPCRAWAVPVRAPFRARTRHGSSMCSVSRPPSLSRRILTCRTRPIRH